MTSLRWDNVPKPRVERSPWLAPSSKSARRKQKPSNLKDRIEEVVGARIELQELARSASAAARATSANMRSARCSTCKARGVTLWQVAGRLVCANCRKANEMAYAPQSGRRQEPGRRSAARKEGTVTIAIAEKDIAWAARQGTNDRNAGTECWKYRNFLSIYKLPRSPFTLRMWNAYLLARQSTPRNTARPGSRRDPLIPPETTQKLPSASVAQKDPGWAARQGREDGVAGKACRKYKAFLIAYGLRESDASLQLWKTYRRHTERARLNMSPPRPKRKSCWTRGLALSDATTPRRKTVRRYDRVKSRESKLSPEIAALLMKVNQQDTLVDMWR